MQIKTLYSYIRSRNDKYLQVTFFFHTHTYTHTLIASPNKKHPRRINNPVAENTLTAQLVISKYSCPLKMINDPWKNAAFRSGAEYIQDEPRPSC